MKIVCTICSKSKNDDYILMQAQERYTGSHVSKSKDVSKREGVPFFILSGLFGLIPATEEIPYYDHLLEDSEVPTLTLMVEEQLVELHVSEIVFCVESEELSPNWSRYYSVLKGAAEKASIPLAVHKLS